ncbi:MAG: hydroxymethylglutaryl-CoA synthase [Deltaproteobacteria bacterium]|nr:hydroxymethylglutaryl-CoA synthase [Deltaproteobacteria bacterium]
MSDYGADDTTSMPDIGVSGFAIHLPRLRVPLKDWCAWTGSPWPKVRDNVGTSFRVLSPCESVYTMSANAVLRLILAYGVNPRDVGFLALGTESGTDNSAGAILVKGMVDEALEGMGLPRISRHCEVPEYKHACLGGVYALKGALRYVACDGRGRVGIVVSADVAEYERGSSGEQTQGAGAVAQLVEANPRLYAVDLFHAGSAAAYRGVDFRKPHRRHLEAPVPEGAHRSTDTPIFNGLYSTVCYTDAALRATGRMLQRLRTDALSLYNGLDGAFFHRPYHRLPVNVFAALYIWGLSRDAEHLAELAEWCRLSGADFGKMRAEAASNPDLFEGALGGHINKEAYPEAMKVVRFFRDTAKFKEVAARKMHLGTEAMREVGNIYTGSLPAWIAAGIEDALDQGVDLTGHTFYTLGYGSGDAAEAMLIKVVPGWRDAAARIGFKASLQGAVDLRREEYEALHDGLSGPCPPYEPSREFIIDRVGATRTPDFEDMGIEYYRYVP